VLLGLFQEITGLHEELIMLASCSATAGTNVVPSSYEWTEGGHGQRPPEMVMCTAMIGRLNCSKTWPRAAIGATATVDHLLDNGGTW
jgi:hypothetical protein